MTLSLAPGAAQSTALRRLGMAQLSPAGLSEQWLLRDCGDRHWAMLSRLMGRDEGFFQDAGGRPLYAAFCATELELAPCAAPPLGAALTIRAALGQVSAARTGSEHALEIDGREVGRLRMLSVFVGHGRAGDNRSVARRAPVGAAQAPAAGEGLRRLAHEAAAEARDLRAEAPGDAPDAVLRPAPQEAFNAAGLLYFPSFTALAARAMWEAAGIDAPPRRRSVTYLGNLDPGEAVSCHLAEGGMRCDLRDRAGAPLARVRSVF